MRTCLLWLLFGIGHYAFAQPPKTANNSKVTLKGNSNKIKVIQGRTTTETVNQSIINLFGNNNIVQIYQGVTIVKYDTRNEAERQQLVDYLIDQPVVINQLSRAGVDIKQLKQNGQLPLLQIVKILMSKEGYISLTEYEKSLEDYITKYNQIKVELAQLKDANKEEELGKLLAKAQEFLDRFDSEGYQQVLEAFKQKQLDKIQTSRRKVAQLAYLQAQNSYTEFQYKKALEQIKEAIEYDASNAQYIWLKGSILNKINRLQEALATFLSIDELYLDEVSRGRLFNSMGNVYASRGESSKALQQYTKALSILQKSLGPEHPDVAMVYNNIGTIYNDQGQYNKALEYYEKDLAITLKVFGPMHPNVAQSYNNIGSVYKSKGKYDKAIKYHTDALSIRLKVLSPEHPDVAQSYNSIGIAYDLKGEDNKALKYYEKDLAITLKVFGPMHPNVAQSYVNIGAAYHDQGQYDKALEYYEKALVISLKALGPEHYYVATSYNKIASVYKSKGEQDKALEYYNKALKSYMKSVGPEDPQTKRTLKNIKTLTIYNDVIFKIVILILTIVVLFLAFRHKSKVKKEKHVGSPPF